MPYSAQINRNQPTALVFLIDQSGSMDERMSSGKMKSEFVADVLNKTLVQLIVPCQKPEGVRYYFDIGVVAYGGNGVCSGFGGCLADAMLQPIPKVKENPLRIEQRMRKVDDGVGGVIEQSVKFPVWFDPCSSGGTPMCEALRRVAGVLVDWCNAHAKSYPPTVIHVTDGASQDGDPEPIAQQLQQTSTDDGPCLLFNLHISTAGGTPVMFPASEAALPDNYSKLLFRCSSPFPPHLLKPAQEKGYAVTAESRFFGYNADIDGIVDFFDIGTRATELR
jgi:hypothetical protein